MGYKKCLYNIIAHKRFKEKTSFKIKKNKKRNINTKSKKILVFVVGIFLYKISNKKRRKNAKKRRLEKLYNSILQNRIRKNKYKTQKIKN